MKSSPRWAREAWERCIAPGDMRLDRIVAIKILSPHLSHDPTLRQRFEREAKTISSLNIKLTTTEP
ncbi:MAG: hypothetical protein ACLQOO_36035 [Terriglobia bacterium]